MCVQNLKSVALPVPEIIGVPKKFRAVPGYAHIPYSNKIPGLPYRLFRYVHSFSGNFKIGVLGGVANLQSRLYAFVGGLEWYRPKERW